LEDFLDFFEDDFLEDDFLEDDFLEDDFLEEDFLDDDLDEESFNDFSFLASLRFLIWRFNSYDEDNGDIVKRPDSLDDDDDELSDSSYDDGEINDDIGKLFDLSDTFVLTLVSV
jgi:hypothetical protein